MKELNEVKSIINNLTTSEHNDVYKRLRKNDSRNISLRLFELLNNKVKLKSNDLQTLLYDGQNNNAFNKMVHRILEKIFDVLLLKDNIINNDLYDKRAKDIFLLEHQLLISEILRYRGLFEISLSKLEKVILKCKYYEHYDILLYALEKKFKWSYSKYNKMENNNILKEIDYYYKIKNYVRESNVLFLEILKLNSDVDFSFNRKYILNSLNKLNIYYSKSKSNQIAYYILFIKIQYYYLLTQYKNALKYNDEIIEYLINNKNIYSRVKHGNALLNKGALLRKNFEFEGSLQNLIESKKYLLNQDQNNIIVYEQLYLTYYYFGNILKLKYYLNILEKELYVLDDNYCQLKYNLSFYISVYYFITGNNKSSIKYWNNLPNMKVSFCLNMEVRILNILNSIELLKYDLADNLIQNMRKYNARNKVNLKYFDYYNNILKILIITSLNSYDFKKTQTKVLVNLIKLKNIISNNYLNEKIMIIFHEWFEAKVKGMPYNHAEVMKRIRKQYKPPQK